MTEQEKQSMESISDEPKMDKSSGAWSGSVLPGIILIGLGLMFLANNLTGFSIDNWWAFFILIPAANNFGEAMRSMRRDGRLSRSARGQFFWSLFFVLLSAAFLLDLSFGLIWPGFLILAGLGILLGAL